MSGYIGFSKEKTRNDWATPLDFFQGLDTEFGFGLDVCAHERNRKCSRFFGVEADGLSRDWSGYGPCWMNPPYDRTIGQWVAKARAESEKGTVIVCLLPVRTDTAWWHEHVLTAAREIRFIRGRLRFDGTSGSAPFPSCIVIFGGGSAVEKELPILRSMSR